MDSLDGYPLQFEDMPLKLSKTAGRISKQMSQPKSTTTEVKAPKAKYSKTRGEHFKDIVIAMLITGIIAFISGMHFQASQQEAIETAVKGAQTTAPVKK